MGATQNQSAHSIEEKLNSLTHGIGAGMSIAGLVYLLVLTRMGGGDTLTYLSFSLYGSFQILLYLSSALTHQFSDIPRVNKVFRILDQTAVYLLISGTYTPVALLGLKGAWGWSIFGVIWGFAIIGIFLKTLVFREKHLISDIFYLPMGWTIIIAVKPLIRSMPSGFCLWVLLGGVLYSVGIIFYISKRIPMSHVIWHLFVLGGSIAFYLGFVFYLI